jgi:predicted protein tyrosine phosphatase
LEEKQMIHVTPLSRLSEIVAETQARHLISLLSATASFERPAGLEDGDCLHITINDIVEDQDGLVAPARHHVEALLDFARRWDRTGPLVVHCYAGISRSTAAAYVIAAALQPERDEMDLALELRARSPSATPNSRIVALADDLLRRDGRMIAAIGSIGRGAEASEGVPFVLAVG